MLPSLFSCQEWTKVVNAISCTPVVPCSLFQVAHFDKNLLMAPFAPESLMRLSQHMIPSSGSHYIMAMSQHMPCDMWIFMQDYLLLGILWRHNLPSTLMTPSWNTGEIRESYFFLRFDVPSALPSLPQNLAFDSTLQSVSASFRLLQVRGVPLNISDKSTL